MTDDEKVLCVDVASVRGIVKGPCSNEEKLWMLLKMKQYLNRNTPNDDGPPVEEDDRWKQLIPYIVVVNKDGQILAHNRGSKGGEKRLENLWAIGFGGHVKLEDADWMAGIKRELREELDVKQPISIEKQFGGEIDWAYFHGPIGLLNDDSNDVGRKHLGVVYVLRADEVTPKEVKRFEWINPSMTKESDVDFENWSVLAMPMVREFLKGGA